MGGVFHATALGFLPTKNCDSKGGQPSTPSVDRLAAPYYKSSGLRFQRDPVGLGPLLFRELEHRFPSWKQTGAGSEVSQGRAFAARRLQGRSEALSLDLPPALRTLPAEKMGDASLSRSPVPADISVLGFLSRLPCNRSLARASLPAAAWSISSCIRSRLIGSPLASPYCRLSRMVRRPCVPGCSHVIGSAIRRGTARCQAKEPR